MKFTGKIFPYCLPQLWDNQKTFAIRIKKAPSDEGAVTAGDWGRELYPSVKNQMDF